MDPFYDKSTLIKILSFFYRTMLASAPLLEFAIPKTEGWLRDYYEQHLEEERGHELMVQDDLKRLGVDEIERFHFAAQFAGSQYYLIAHDHPALLLGFMRALESSGTKVEDVEKLEAHHETALTAFRHHALHDPQHKTDLDRMIDGFDDELKARIVWNETNTRMMLESARI